MKLCLEKGDTISPIVVPIGGLRESEKKIYFIGQDYELSDHYEEVLLYDFTKQVGDTIIHDIYGTLSSIIEGIDSILIGNEYRKMYTVNTGWLHYPDYIIEGIGSIKNGLLGHITNIPTCGYHYWEHICYREDGQVKFLNPVFTNCFPAYLLSSLNAIPELSEIKIFPNPFMNQLYIEDIPVNANLNLQIINATGQEILSRKLITPNDIITKSIVKGLYIINIRDINGKIIKNDKIIRK